MHIEFIIALATALFGGLSTYYLQSNSIVTKVQASALTTLAFSMSLYMVTNLFALKIDSTHYMAIFWGASFAGMSSSKIFDWKSIVIASTLFTLLFELSESVEKGHGGKLGLIAAIASISAIAIVSTLNFTFKRLSKK